MFVKLLKNIKNHLDFTAGFGFIVFYRLYGNFCSFFIGEHKYTCGNAAKRNTVYFGLIRQFQTGAIAGRKLPAMERCQFPPHNRADRMDDIFTWQIKGRGDFSCPCGFLMSLLFHKVAAIISELDTGIGMNTICYAYLNHTFHPHFPEKNHHSRLLSSLL